MTQQIQTILVLGGGIHNDGTLTNLSRQRLDRAAELFRAGTAPTITVLGEAKSTYLPGAIQFDKPGAQRRAEYLAGLNIPEDKIIQIRGGRDTIGEALAARAHLPDLGITDFMLVTSEIHIPRALWLFSTLLGPDYKITPHGVPCGGILLAAEELEYLNATKHHFNTHPDRLENQQNWHENNPELYTRFKEIHDHFHPPGKESEAYTGVVTQRDK